MIMTLSYNISLEVTNVLQAGIGYRPGFDKCIYCEIPIT